MSNSALIQDQNFLAGIFDVAQKMRTQHDLQPVAVADVADHADHALPRRRIEAVGRFVQNQQLRSVRDRLGQLRQLFHPKRISSQFPIPRLGQAHAEQGFMRPFECRLRGQS